MGTRTNVLEKVNEPENLLFARNRVQPIAAKPVEASLPPDPEKTNGNRAKWAGVAVKAFEKETGVDGEDALSDLLCNLKHWADRNGMDFSKELDRADINYREETTA